MPLASPPTTSGSRVYKPYAASTLPAFPERGRRLNERHSISPILLTYQPQLINEEILQADMCLAYSNNPPTRPPHHLAWPPTLPVKPLPCLFTHIPLKIVLSMTINITWHSHIYRTQQFGSKDRRGIQEGVEQTSVASTPTTLSTITMMVFLLPTQGEGVFLLWARRVHQGLAQAQLGRQEF